MRVLSLATFRQFMSAISQACRTPRGKEGKEEKRKGEGKKEEEGKEGKWVRGFEMLIDVSPVRLGYMIGCYRCSV